MEDFPKQTINLIHTNGSQEVKTTNDAISKIPIQFLLKVVPSIPSCTEGLYLPRFLPPTPDNRAQIYTVVNQTVEIPIMAEATQSTITELLFSGPYNVVKNTSGSGSFTLKWTPSQNESEQSHSICFVVQASHSNILYQSELRCVAVLIDQPPPPTPSPTTPSPPPTTPSPPPPPPPRKFDRS
ncbi:protein cappuccino-like isoform X2 [Kryptolebias marmoratus]|uniref:protein cappuccino-like isoform X2 n=1 Tax=Kryptolebias marmoratus TaxID=37003 RepID=UPI0018ACFB57|nr:protein cappuccino-like isoform X2 [Kryptolebias marmoratus]